MDVRERRVFQTPGAEGFYLGIHGGESALSPERSEPAVVWMIPSGQENILKHGKNPEFYETFLSISNPLGISPDVFGHAVEAREHVIRVGDQFAQLRYARAQDIADPDFLAADSRAVGMTGSELLFGKVLFGSEVNGLSFSHLRYGKMKIPFFDDWGRSFTPMEIFDQLPDLPPGAVLELVNGKHTEEITVLPFQEGSRQPVFSLMGRTEYGNFARAKADALQNGERIVIGYKKGHEGIVQALFMQPDDNIPTRFIELSSNGRMVMGIDGEYNGYQSLPAIVPGLLDILAIPVEGKTENFVREGMRRLDRDVYGISRVRVILAYDVIETGFASADRFETKPDGTLEERPREDRLIPVDVRSEPNVGVDGEKILGMYDEDQDAYHQYKAQMGIMPVYIVGAKVKTHVVDLRNGHGTYGHSPYRQGMLDFD